MAISLVAILALSACDKERIRAALPPAKDLAVKQEPPFPEAALTDANAERAWNDQVLLWGRDGWLQVGRICRWAKRNGADVQCSSGEAP